jgi:hypothetical protein
MVQGQIGLSRQIAPRTPRFARDLPLMGAHLRISTNCETCLAKSMADAIVIESAPNLAVTTTRVLRGT